MSRLVVKSSRDGDYLGSIIASSLQESKILAQPDWFFVKQSDHNQKHKYRNDVLQSLRTLHRDLIRLFDGGVLFQEWEQFMKLRSYMQIIYADLMQKDLKFCCQQNVDQYFWKLLYYAIIQIYKKIYQRKELHSKLDLQSNFLQITESGIEFYQKLISLLEKEYNFSLAVISNVSLQKQQVPSFVIVMVQKLLISLGDLSRYNGRLIKNNNYESAIQFYKTAQKLLPTNGVPYNQLAIISINMNKRLDAVYYHIRSLESSNPIKSAKESLNIIFDEIRKKHDNVSKGNAINKKDNNNKNRNLSSLRREIWNHPDGSRRLHQMDSEFCENKLTYIFEENMKLSLQPLELKKRFVTSFLCVHGKLFTRTGMEDFQSSATQMLNEFKHLLQTVPLVISDFFIIQILTINIFLISFNRKRGKADFKDEVCRHSFEIAHLMFTLLVNRVTELFSDRLASNHKKKTTKVLRLDDDFNFSNRKPIKFDEIEEKEVLNHIPDDVSILCQGVKIWCDWLSVNETLWHVSGLNYLNSSLLSYLNVDPWESFAQFITILSSIRINNESITNFKEFDLQFNGLDEDIILRGYQALETEDSKQMDISCETVISKNMHGVIRLRKIFYFGANYLSSLPLPILILTANADGQLIYSKVKEQNPAEGDSESFEKLDDLLSPDDDDFDEKQLTIEKNERIIETSDTTKMDWLRQKKTELEKRQKMQENYKHTLKKILQNSDIRLHLEVYPKILVPDTNCFIDFLTELKTVADSPNGFLLYIPIVVIKELEGLSKGLKVEDSSYFQPPSTSSKEQSNLTEVSLQSKKALLFIKSKNASVRFVTSKGSILNSHRFTMEEGDVDISNDDIILNTAINLCKSNNEYQKDAVLFIKTEVVLLTTDRNLRVKALSRNLAVSQLPKFLEWAGLANMSKCT